MKDYYFKYNTEYSWLIKEEGWVKAIQSIRETQLALANGVFGSRAVLEEIPYDSKPGTYIAGLYDSVGSQVAELVNLPNPFNFKITVDGEKLGAATMDTLEHKRVLNIRHGILCRRSVFQDTRKKKYDYQSLRFVSMDNKNIGVMQVIFTPLDSAVNVSVETGLDTAVYNAGTVTEGRKKHFRIKELGQFKDEGYLIVETFGKAHKVIFRSGFYYQTRGKKTFAKDNIFELKLDKNQTIIFTKIFYLDSASQGEDFEKVKNMSEKKFRQAFRTSFKNLLKKHMDAWEGLWGKAEVSIWGDPEVEKIVRFNIYHMLICSPQDKGKSSIGAKALTSEGYRGHIFWDTEIFLLPFYLYTFPETAKNILLYRYNRLETAKERAKRNCFEGAMFPWESAASGEDETPAYAKDLDGKVIKIHTGQKEHHITADIAYAFHHYYNVTDDEEFFQKYGYEVIFEAARFWASRVEYNKKKDAYEIKDVIGPDEFHRDVNNNAFTNILAKWNLFTASKLFQKIKKSKPDVFKKLTQKTSATAQEARNWKRIASHININKRKQDHIIEQFDGYFKKRKIKISEWDENGLPVLSEKMTPREYGTTQLVKQADVVMLLYLFSDVFNLKTKQANYEFYVARTLHKSSLSLPPYAILAIDAGDRNRAYRFFWTALRTDISNINNNTGEGIHAACIGGVWQVLINGFAGIRVDQGILSINPKLPNIWRKIIFSLNWKKCVLKLEIQNERVAIDFNPAFKKRIKVKVFGSLHELAGKRSYVFKTKKGRKSKKEDHY